MIHQYVIVISIIYITNVCGQTCPTASNIHQCAPPEVNNRGVTLSDSCIPGYDYVGSGIDAKDAAYPDVTKTPTKDPDIFKINWCPSSGLCTVREQKLWNVDYHLPYGMVLEQNSQSTSFQKTTTYTTTDEIAKELTLEVGLPLGKAPAIGKASIIDRASKSFSKSKSYSITQETVRLGTLKLDEGTLEIDADFAAQLTVLGTISDVESDMGKSKFSSKYKTFFHTYGTHYVTEVKIGGKVYAEYSADYCEYQEEKEEGIGLGVETDFGGVMHEETDSESKSESSSIKQEEQGQKGGTTAALQHSKDCWIQSCKAIPEVIGYKLTMFDKILDMNVAAITTINTVAGSLNVDLKANIRKATEQYLQASKTASMEKPSTFCKCVYAGAECNLDGDCCEGAKCVAELSDDSDDDNDERRRLSNKKTCSSAFSTYSQSSYTMLMLFIVTLFSTLFII